MKINKTYISQKGVSILFIILLMCIFTSVKSYAAPLSLGVYPPLIKMKTAPNTHIQQKIIISNYANNPTTVDISLKMFTSSYKNNGEITFLPNDTTSKNFFSEHIKVLDGTIPVNQLLLSPRESKSITLDLTSGKDQSDADYYISLLFITNTPDQLKSNAAILSEGVATNILFSIVSQLPTEGGYIKQFTGPRVADNDTIPFVVEVANQGNHYTSAKGTITINNMLLNSKDIINLQAVDILKGTFRYMTNKEGLPFSHVLWKHGFLFGVYRADLDIYFKDNKDGFHRSIYFYSYPIVGFVIALVVMFFSSIVLFRIRKRRS